MKGSLPLTRNKSYGAVVCCQLPLLQQVRIQDKWFDGIGLVGWDGMGQGEERMWWDRTRQNYVEEKRTEKNRTEQNRTEQKRKEKKRKEKKRSLYVLTYYPINQFVHHSVGEAHKWRVIWCYTAHNTQHTVARVDIRLIFTDSYYFYRWFIRCLERFAVTC